MCSMLPYRARRIPCGSVDLGAQMHRRCLDERATFRIQDAATAAGANHALFERSP